MQSTTNNYYIVQNFKITTFQVFESFKQWPKDFEDLNNDQRLGDKVFMIKGIWHINDLKRAMIIFAHTKF